MVKFFDPHFHMWDTAAPNAVISAQLIGPPAAMHPVYTVEDLRLDLAAAGGELVGAVHVEALASDGLAEAQLVANAAATSSVPLFNVPRVDLAAADAENKLDQLVKTHGTTLVKGVRMILNWEPTWPLVERGDYLTSSDFERGYASLARFGLSFDLQINPRQMKDAAALAAKYPNVPVILNHLGALKLGRPDISDELAIHEWREGMKALAAAGPHVFVKISMLAYTDKNWDKPGSVVPGLVRETIELFGVERCMLASNFPVDKPDGFDAARLLAGFELLARDYTDAQRQALYVDTARRAYRV